MSTKLCIITAILFSGLAITACENPTKTDPSTSQEDVLTGEWATALDALSTFMKFDNTSSAITPLIFFKIEGIEGSSEHTDHMSEIEILSLNLGTTINVNSVVTRQNSDNAQLSDITLIKKVDKATPTLSQAAINGQYFTTAELTLRIRNAGSGQQDAETQTYLKYKLKRVLISSVSTSNSCAGDPPDEIVKLKFDTAEWEYQPQKKNSGIPD